jgi:hypothetical protein
MILFFNMIDVTAYNAFIFWTTINPNWNGNKLTKRRLFLEQLGKELVKTQISSRTHMPRTEESRRIVKNARRGKATRTIEDSTRNMNPKTSSMQILSIK